MNRTTILALAPTVFAAAALSAETPDGVTFTNDVAPIFVKSCMTCHRPGEIAPMSLLSYDVTAKRQSTQLFAGDEPAAYQKTWAGRIEIGDGAFTVVTRRHSFGFTNADAFRDELEGMVGQEVEIIGLWRVDRIEIQKIGPRAPR